LPKNSVFRLRFWQKSFHNSRLPGCCKLRAARAAALRWPSCQGISLLDVVEAIDGPIALNECVHDDGACNFGEDCPLRPIWCEAQEDLVNA
jgi:hypothetical protein